jgi:hypothetical protein
LLNPQAFPLEWPGAVARWRGGREEALFRHGVNRIGIGEAVRRVLRELDLFKADEIVLSSNLRPTLAGLPSGSVNDRLADPGAAVYFRIDGEPRAIACDKWSRVSDNVAAIAADIEAKRGQVRWGASSRAQIFGGYKALPAMGASRPWWQVLEVTSTATLEQVERARDELLAKWHPDKPGGSHARAAEINAAVGEARLEVRRAAG